uniref:Rubicon Homology domain-containing protein n=1 Tax=Labrus bergylta TaxID=56723 RepID=A0A3Q3GJ59_9LABR
MQLFHMKNLFKTCRFAKEVLEQFDSLPGHLTEDLHLFSLNDLSAVRNGDLAPRMKELLKLGTIHAAGCVLCQAKGFVCEFCGNDKDIIFPFQLNKCQRCEECHACYHRNCFRAGKDCPRCQRLAERRERMARKNMEEQEDEGGDEMNTYLRRLLYPGLKFLLPSTAASGHCFNSDLFNSYWLS